jgi:ABC-type lipoprotein release transport system permease subunit
MLIALAWKNVWRKKKRSLIIIAAITFGLWGGLFSGAVMIGSMESMVETAISRSISHIQIHKPDYEKDKDVRNVIPDGIKILKQVRSVKNVGAAAGRTLVMAMAASPTSSYGVQITGIVPEDSRKITDIHSKIIEGDYFVTDRINQIVVGKKLADRLNLKIRSKVVLSFQDLNGNIAYVACRVVGIYKSSSTAYDELNVFVRQRDLFRILETEPIIHEIALRAEYSDHIDSVKAELVAQLPGLQIESWNDLAPELAYISETTALWSYIFVGIILFALLFGITNTMLMSVVDRTKEFGVLIAIGMKKWKIFSMIILETIFLSLTGGLAGMGVGAITIGYYNNSGIDLSSISTSLESFGVSTMLYPALPIAMYIILTIMIVLAANVAALLPAWKATHLVPSQAIRTY